MVTRGRKLSLSCFFSLVSSAVSSSCPHSLTNLQTQLSLVCEERDELAQELKRTPQLIQKALADLKEQCERPHDS